MHLVVTRNMNTGVKQVYVNGSLDASSTGSTVSLNSPVEVDVGYVSGSNLGINGEIDDIQIYTNMLSASQVAFIYNNPGSTTANFNFALNTTNLTWTTGGFSAWTVETTNTIDGTAARSGSLTGSHTNFIQTTVTGPGTVNYYWSTLAAGFGFDLEFDIDGVYQDDISGNTSWYQESIYSIGSGVHTLTWIAYQGGDSNTNEAGYLDQVNYTPAVTGPSPFSLSNPQRSGTNFQFSFVSQASFTSTVYYTTNLTGTWQMLTNITGDGTTKTVTVGPGPWSEYFRVLDH